MNLEALKFRQSQIKNVLESSRLPSLGNSAREGDFIILIRDSSRHDNLIGSATVQEHIRTKNRSTNIITI
jgi:hypothetical protein